MFVLFLLLSTAIATHRQLQVVHQVIVIGAGAAGIGASATLSQNQVDHIILQARDRIGGRVWAGPLGTTFNPQAENANAGGNRTNGTSGSSSAGRGIDFGAAHVLNSFGQNSINPIVDDLGWGKVATNFSNNQVFYQRPYSLSPNQSALAAQVYQKFILFATHYVSLQGDTDLQTTWDRFVVSLNQSTSNSSTSNLTNQTVHSAIYNQTILNRVYFYLAQQTNINGADITFLSTHAFLKKPNIGEKDYTPAGSYAQLLTAVLQRYANNTQIIFNEFVDQIDYSGPAVKITTRNKNIYYAPKVIITVPLGLLQAKDVTFIPELPLEYQNVINSLGNGVLNKIVIQLDKSFWNTNAVLLQFVNAIGKPIVFPEAVVYPEPKNNILTFYISGNTSRVLNQRTDAQIVSLLVSLLPQFINTNQSISVSNLYTVTRWEQDAYSLGSYSFYTPRTLVSNLSTLLQPVDNKIWLAGEHTHPNQTGTVQGAYQTGVWAAQSTNSQWWLVSMWVVLILMLYS